ncbi:PRC-barrel domain protein [Clostridium acetireducens DSM 10703]|jgi:YlmC/YmxH family sporulation protein|uniref:PRC-barrel domain protein n=1 Tax=Clostridium acetireducens DSM 10703 TaxID=1121290 RepID=A0A1E8F268_9CLOT|nr:YlmC/YmxH family sporulation protein [Clostridium acetireducens]OFI07737.1 PRC-barrel domain protein [Clostridium acetireducens DSM 10703]
MEESIKMYSEIERYEIININDGDKFGYLGTNDVVINDKGELILLILDNNTTKFNLFNKSEYIEVPWKYVKKVGAKTIIIDVDKKSLKKIH